MEVPTRVGVYRSTEPLSGPARVDDEVPTRVGVYRRSRVERVISHTLEVPTRVGVYRVRRAPAVIQEVRGSPHTRGGVPSLPLYSESAYGAVWKSPHAWGCTDMEQQRRHTRRSQEVPTRVGVYRSSRSGSRRSARSPHTRGGVPTWRRSTRGARRKSPHAWGCTDGNGGKYIACETEKSPHAWGCTVGIYLS